MTVTITNLGTIVGGVSLLGNASYTLHNCGRIEGQVRLDGAADSVVNKGVITGAVSMGDGGDVFDDSLGRGPLGLDLGAGDDLAKLGRAAETVTGGDGLDVVSYEAARARVVLSLGNQAKNAGAALGDRFDGVEVFRGSARGDVMVGDAGANRLEGLAGDDRLIGAAGDDTLVGGAGADLLRGGLGGDVFVFDGAGADRVLDFRGDVLGLVGAAFGLEAGALAASALAVRAGHVAQGRERVLFDTTDKTLWVDVDGAGGAEAVLVAQLQANAQVSAADILVP